MSRPKSETDRVSVYIPEHPRARANGHVYEHILVAERLLGRPLKPGEVVHHKDSDSSNNADDNLMVFRSQGEHIRHHAGHEATPLSDGTYGCPKPVCKVCDGPVSRPYFKNDQGDKVCRNCYSQPSKIPPSDELKKLVWEMPSVEVAKMFGVSDTTVKKWCRKYGIEKPGRGYWAGQP